MKPPKHPFHRAHPALSRISQVHGASWALPVGGYLAGLHYPLRRPAPLLREGGSTRSPMPEYLRGLSQELQGLFSCLEVDGNCIDLRDLTRIGIDGVPARILRVTLHHPILRHGQID